MINGKMGDFLAFPPKNSLWLILLKEIANRLNIIPHQGAFRLPLFPQKEEKIEGAFQNISFRRGELLRHSQLPEDEGKRGEDIIGDGNKGESPNRLKPSRFKERIELLPQQIIDLIKHRTHRFYKIEKNFLFPAYP